MYFVLLNVHQKDKIIPLNMLFMGLFLMEPYNLRNECAFLTLVLFIYSQILFCFLQLLGVQYSNVLKWWRLV